MKKFLFATVLLLVGGGSAAAQTPITAAGVKSTTVNSSNRNEIFAITDQMLVTGKVGPLVFAEHDGVGVQISGIEAEKGDIITDIVGKLTKVSYAKNAFSATECTKVSSGNVVTPFVVSKADVVSKSAELDARLVMVEEVNFEAAAASNGIFNMTVTPAQSDLGIMLSVTGSIPYVTPANVSGYITWSQMGTAMMSMKALTIESSIVPNYISAADVKATKVTSANRNEEYTINDQLLVTGKVGPLVFAECNGVGLQISGINAEKGDIITNVVGKLTKVSYAKNTFAATDFQLVSSGNEVVPFIVSKADVLANAEALDARCILVKDVEFTAAAASNGNFNMTVTPAQSNLGIMLSVTGEVSFVSTADVIGYITWSQMGAAMMSMKAVSIVGDPSLFVLPTEISNIDDLLTFPVKFPAAREISASGYSPLAAIFDASGDAYAIAFGSRFGDCQFEGNEAIFHFVRIADLTAELKKAARSLVASHVGSVDAGSATVFICGKSFKIDGQLYELPISKTYDYNAGLTTGIHAISESIDAPAYDLNGRVMKPVSGQMFIKNGKKVIK